MRVLGFDPGTATTGYGVVEAKGSRLQHIAHGIISTPPEHTFAERLKTIFLEAQRLLGDYLPDAVTLEKIYFSQNVTTAISVAQARGVLAAAVALAGKPVTEFSPLEVKNAVVNLDALPKPDDAADALALAICHLHSARLDLRQPR
jgi:crossover junction endodeoxyribonuclease RuvC